MKACDAQSVILLKRVGLSTQKGQGLHSFAAAFKLTLVVLYTQGLG